MTFVCEQATHNLNIVNSEYCSNQNSITTRVTINVDM